MRAAFAHSGREQPRRAGREEPPGLVPVEWSEHVGHRLALGVIEVRQGTKAVITLGPARAVFAIEQVEGRLDRHAGPAEQPQIDEVLRRTAAADRLDLHRRDVGVRGEAKPPRRGLHVFELAIRVTKERRRHTPTAGRPASALQWGAAPPRQMPARARAGVAGRRTASPGRSRSRSIGGGRGAGPERCRPRDRTHARPERRSGLPGRRAASR